MKGSDLAIGVDGGNTKTLALACDLDGHALGIGRGGSTNWEGMGLTSAAQALAEIIEQALTIAGGRREQVRRAHLGLAGIDWPDDGPRLRQALAEAGWHGEMTLENDSFLTVRAGAPEGHGIGVTAGTGICAAIIRPDGGKYFYGGFTDLGGGYDTATQALQAVVRAEDGRGRPTALTQAVLKATGYSSARDLVYSIHRERKQVANATMNVVLFATAEKGDAVAAEIVTRFGRELALCATNLITRYRLAEEAPAVVAAGSRFVKTGPLLFDVFRQEVLAAAPRARVILSDQPPVMGAVRGALQAAGRQELEVWEQLRRTVAEQGLLRDETGAAARGEDDD